MSGSSQEVRQDHRLGDAHGHIAMSSYILKSLVYTDVAPNVAELHTYMQMARGYR